MTTAITSNSTPPDQRPGAPDRRGPAAARLPIIVSARRAVRGFTPIRAVRGFTPIRAVRGFTLIEMMCTVTVAGLLSSVAYPSYQGAVAKARRADALAATMAVQAAEERYRSGSLSYGSLSQIGVAGTSPSGHYTLAVVNPSASGYAVMATAAGSQSSDTACRFLKVTADGANVSYASGDSAATANDAAANKRCWNL